MKTVADFRPENAFTEEDSREAATDDEATVREAGATTVEATAEAIAMSNNTRIEEVKVQLASVQGTPTDACRLRIRSSIIIYKAGPEEPQVELWSVHHYPIFTTLLHAIPTTFSVNRHSFLG